MKTDDGTVHLNLHLVIINVWYLTYFSESTVNVIFPRDIFINKYLLLLIDVAL